jgi:hypothetical protein
MEEDMYKLILLKNGTSSCWLHQFDTVEKALLVGHEAVLQGSAEYFRVEEESCGWCNHPGEYVSDVDRWGDTWPRCTSCGGN